MREPTVAKVMTRNVVSVVPDTPFKELVGTMIVHDLDALPVIDPTGRPVGVVAEADALAKLEFHGGADRPPLLAGARCRARWHKASGLIAADLMTTPTITVTEGTPLTAAVRVLTDHGVRRLYVVDCAGYLVGALTRPDALKLFLRGDSAILADVKRDVAGVAKGPHQINVQVTAGVVTLTGELTLHSSAQRASSIASHVPGVIAVHNSLRYDLDDLTISGL